MKLPERSSADWNVILPSIAMSVPSSKEQSPFVVDAFTVQAPWVSTVKPCPVKHANRDEWTEVERQKADDRVVAKSLEHLQQLVCHLRILFTLS